MKHRWVKAEEGWACNVPGNDGGWCGKYAVVSCVNKHPRRVHGCWEGRCADHRDAAPKPTKGARK